MLRDLLGQQGLEVGRRHVKTLMRRMGTEAIYRRPNTSKPAPGHRIYPYLLRNLAITRPDQAWAMDISYIPMARGFTRSVKCMRDIVVQPSVVEEHKSSILFGEGQNERPV